MDFCRFFYFILYFYSFRCGIPVVSTGCCCLCCALLLPLLPFAALCCPLASCVEVFCPVLPPLFAPTLFLVSPCVTPFVRPYLISCFALCLRAYGLFFLVPPLVRKNPSFFSCVPCLYGLILSFFSISPYQSLKIFSVNPGNFNTLRTNALICYFESVTFSVKKLNCGDSPQNNTDCSVIFQSQSVSKSFFQSFIY